MMRLLVIRPGATAYDDQGRIRGRLDIPLTQQGVDQVAQVVRETSQLPIECIYTAPCQPALQTAQALASVCGVKVKRSQRLQNLHAGLWEGKLIAEVRAQQPKVYRRWQEQPETVCPPEGEMVSAARQRLRELIEKTLRKHRWGVIALIVPEPLATVLCCMLKNEELGDLWHAERTGASWELIEIEPAATLAGRL
jgi:probable phosphoglycerate mutase